MAKKKKAKKRTKPLPGIELERVVLQVQRLMGPDATAEHNQRIEDRLGHLRQVDVFIRGTFGGWPMMGVIECKDNTRPKGLDDVEAFAKKTEHLGAGLRLMVSKKGFTKTALDLAKHERIHCLSLLSHDSHSFGMEIGEWWYGVISRWEDYRLTVSFADEARKTDVRLAEDVLWQGKPVFNWFRKQFEVTFRDRTVDGGGTISVPFDQVTDLEIRGQHYPVTALSCSAKGVFMKKRKWVTYSGQAFFDWHSGKITIPPGVKVDTAPVGDNLFLWEDYSGEIPAIDDLTDSPLAKFVMMLTQVIPPDLPIPDLEQLSSGPPTDDRTQTPAPQGFDPHSPFVMQMLDQVAKSKPAPNESGNPPGVWSFTG